MNSVILELKRRLAYYEVKFNNSCFKRKEKWLRRCIKIKERIKELESKQPAD